jgi:hypothetical protein
MIASIENTIKLGAHSRREARGRLAGAKVADGILDLTEVVAMGSSLQAKCLTR